jgi:hypothetical protein
MHVYALVAGATDPDLECVCDDKGQERQKQVAVGPIIVRAAGAGEQRAVIVTLIRLRAHTDNVPPAAPAQGGSSAQQQPSIQEWFNRRPAAARAPSLVVLLVDALCDALGVAWRGAHLQHARKHDAGGKVLRTRTFTDPALLPQWPCLPSHEEKRQQCLG